MYCYRHVIIEYILSCTWPSNPFMSMYSVKPGMSVVCTVMYGTWSVRYVKVYTGIYLVVPVCTGMYWYIVEKAIYEYA